MHTDTKPKSNPLIEIDFKKFTTNYFQYHVYYCLILADRKNQLAFFSDQFLKKLKEKNLIAI
jgi:hypothetical protein